MRSMALVSINSYQGIVIGVMMIVKQSAAQSNSKITRVRSYFHDVVANIGVKSNYVFLK